MIVKNTLRASLLMGIPGNARMASGLDVFGDFKSHLLAEALLMLMHINETSAAVSRQQLSTSHH